MEDDPILQAGPGFIMPKPDMGAGAAAPASFKEGWARSIGGTIWRAGNYLYARETGKTPLTKAAYDKSYKGVFPYDANMTEEEAGMRLKDYVDDGLRAADMNGHAATSFVGATTGSILSPDLALMMAMPEAKLFNLAQTTGRTGEALLTANAARWTARGLTDNMLNAGANATLQNAAMEPFVYGMDSFIGRKHGLDDTAMNLLAGFGMGSLIGAGKTAWHAYSPDVRQSLARAALRSSLNGEGADPLVGALTGQEAEVNAAARNAADISGESLKTVETPEDISGSEIPEELRQRAYGQEPTDTPSQAEQRQEIRTQVTKSNVLSGADAKESRASFEARTKEFRDNARPAQSEDEQFLNEAFKRVFGTEVYYSDSKGAEGLYGIYSAKEPGRIYIQSGSLDGKGVNMLRIAGHEMGHVIRARDPELWLNMVDTMLDPKVNRHFGDSWKEVRSAKQSSGLWKHMTYHEKMDETLSTVLGHAMQTPDFWVSLKSKSDVNGRKLASYLMKFQNALEAIHIARGTDETGQGKIAPMEAQLGKAVSALDESGQYRFASKTEAVSPWERGLNGGGQPLGSDKKPVIFEGYKARRDKFFQMEQDILSPVAMQNMRASRKMEAVDQALNFLFSDAGNNRASLRSREGTPKLVKTIRRAVYGDPRSFLVMNLFRNMDEISRASLDKLINKVYTDRGSKGNFAQDAFNFFPMATYKDTGAVDVKGRPIYEFSIYHDDKNPMWSENRKPEDFDIDDHKMMVKEHFDNLAEAFVGEAKKLTGDSEEAKTAREEHLGVARDYLDKLEPEDFAEMTTKDLVDGYHTYLDEQMHAALAREDEKAYGNLVDLRSEDRALPAPGEEGDTGKTLYQRVEEVRRKAKKNFEEANNQPWEEFDPEKNYYPPEIQSGDVSDLGLQGAYDTLRGAMFKERMEMMSEDNPALYDMYSKYMSDTQKEEFHQKLYDEIDKAIYDTHPNLRRAMSDKTRNVLIGKEQKPITTNADWLFDGDPLGDIEWEGMEMPLDDMLKNAQNAAGERKAESDAALGRAMTGLKSNYETYKPWLQDVAKMVQKDLPDLLKRNNLQDFEIEDKPKVMGQEPAPPPQRTKAEEGLMKSISQMKKSMRTALADIDNIASGKQRERGPNAPETDYSQERFDLHMRLTDGDRWKSADMAREDTKGYYTNRIRGEILSHEASKRIQSLARKSEKALFSYLDGQPRVGVKGAGMSVDSLRKVQSVADITPLDQTLARFGLRDHWKNNSLVEVVMKYIETGEAKTEEVKQIGDTLRQTVDTQAGRINSVGGGYRFLDGYIMSQTHDGAKIAAARDAWTKYLVNNVDWDKTQKFVGKLDSAQAREAYIDGVFELLVKDRDQDGMGSDSEPGNMLNQTSLRRTIHLQPGKAFEYDSAFGSGNPGANIMSQIVRRGERSVIMDQFGPKYRATWSDAMASMGVQFKNKFSDLRMADETFHQIIGTWDNPVDRGLASMRKAASNVANSAMLWMSGISSITDVGNIVSSLRWAGVPPAELHARVINAIKDGVTTEQGRQALQGSGAGMHALMAGYSRILGDGWFGQTAQKLSDFTMKYSGTELTTKLYQEAMMDLLTQHLGSQAPDHMDPAFKTWLDHYTFTPTEWAEMTKSTAPVPGLNVNDKPMPRLSPDMIPNQKLALKLRAALHDTIAYGQLQPSVSDEALLRLGTRAGTPMGEAVRLVGQYKGYPLAVVNKVSARFKYGYGNTDAPVMGIIPRGVGLTEKLAWSASMITLAYMALAIKDVLRGNEPLNPFEKDHWTWGNATRIIGQAGAGPMATIEQFSSVQQALGPVPGAAYKLGSAFISDDRPGQGYRETEAVFGSLPGASLGPIQEARKQIIGSVMSDAYMTALERARDFRNEKTGQERLLDFHEKKFSTTRTATPKH